MKIMNQNQNLDQNLLKVRDFRFLYMHTCNSNYMYMCYSNLYYFALSTW